MIAGALDEDLSREYFVRRLHWSSISGGSESHLCREIRRKHDLDDKADIGLGRLVEPNANDNEMRGFGKMLARDHLWMSERTQMLAKATGVRLPSAEELKPEAMKEYDRLRRLTGADFDREFLRDVIRDHCQEIKALEQQASETSGDVRSLMMDRL